MATSTTIALLKTLQTMPDSIGMVRTTKDFGSEEIIIVIHDAPTVNRSVQRVISELIIRLVSIRVISLVSMDGAFGKDVDTSWLKDMGDQSLQTAIVDGLLNEGRLTGAEYYSAPHCQDHKSRKIR
jgi:hypothetical protein